MAFGGLNLYRKVMMMGQWESEEKPSSIHHWINFTLPWYLHFCSFLQSLCDMFDFVYELDRIKKYL